MSICKRPRIGKSIYAHKILFMIFWTACLSPVCLAQGAKRLERETALEIFNNRIMPIFRSSDPSSCVQCHLSSVDLKNYILPSHEKTFVSLRDQGLIDLEEPGNSKILKLISMGNDDADENAKMIHAGIRQAEHEAFAAWIESSVDDVKLRNLPPLQKEDLARPGPSDEVIRFTRKNRVINSFVRNVWTQRMRCFPCHTEHEIGVQQAAARKKHEEWVAKFGDRMRIFKKTPRETIQYLVKQSANTPEGSLPMINLEDPAKSLFVLKPTSKLPPIKEGERNPTFTEPVYHMGGLKMHHNDHSYKAITAWIKDYSNVTSGKYKSVDDLPDDNWHPTQKILRIKDIPESWATGKTLQMFVYPKNDHGNEQQQPVAFTQGTITPRHFANGAIILLSPVKEDEFVAWRKSKNRLPPDEYVVKVYLDQSGRLERDPTAFLGDEEYVGLIELKLDVWKAGFKNAKIISGTYLHRTEKSLSSHNQSK